MSVLVHLCEKYPDDEIVQFVNAILVQIEEVTPGLDFQTLSFAQRFMLPVEDKVDSTRQEPATSANDVAASSSSSVAESSSQVQARLQLSKEISLEGR